MNSMANSEVSPEVRTNTFRTLWVVVAYCCALVLVFYQTSYSLVEIWHRDGTYAHGFLILPISLWLMWEKRGILLKTQARANPWVLALMLPVSIAWVFAHLVDVQVVQQLAFVGLMVLGIWAIVGNAVARVLVFPLFFLFLGVPMGSDLVAPLMDFTASSTVHLIQMTGIPVYREGMYFSLPSGNWSVVEACSGVRYLIASFTLGLLYAYMTYRSLSRRLLFILVAILVPVAANSIRAYGIVMLGHLSGMTIATGVDHLIYGWVFFGVVMMVLFFVGSLWREDDVVLADTDSASTFDQGSYRIQSGTVLAGVCILALIVSAMGPLIASSLASVPARQVNASITPPPAMAGWTQLSNKAWTWRPVNAPADRELAQFYQRGDQVVALYVNQYFNQSQGSELEGGGRKFFDRDLDWKIATQSHTQLIFPDGEVEVDEVIMRNPHGRIYVLSWYRIGQYYTTNSYMVKLLELWEQLSRSELGPARIVLATNIIEGVDSKRALQSFLSAHLERITHAMDSGVQGAE